MSDTANMVMKPWMASLVPPWEHLGCTSNRKSFALTGEAGTPYYDYM